jgi:putative transposase
MDWKHLLAYITGTVDQELLLRNEYPVTENRILRNQLKGRVRLTDGERIAFGRDWLKAGEKSPGDRGHHRQTGYDLGLVPPARSPEV